MGFVGIRQAFDMIQLRNGLIVIFLSLLFWCALCAQTYDAEVVTQETVITVKDGKLTKTKFFEIKINNRAGEEYTNVTLPFSKLEKISKIKGYIRDDNGLVVRELKRSEITERSAISNFSFYEDSYVSEFTLKHNVYPYTIAYSYQIKQEEFLYIDYWLPVLNENIPTHNAILCLTVPQNYIIYCKKQFVDIPKIDPEFKFQVQRHF